jgi:Peptidase family M23
VLIRIAFALYPLCLGGAGLVRVLVARPRSWSRWALDIASSASIVAFAFQTGSWAFTSVHLRHVLLGAFALAAARSYRRARARLGSREPAIERARAASAILVLFAGLNAWAAMSHLTPRDSISVAFPLASGTYCVLQGGNSTITNPFHAMSGTRLALDIVRLYGSGNRARGVAPGSLSDYAIFGETVHSPCAGTIVAVRDDGPDNPPGSPDTEHPANQVTVRCGDVEVVLAHLMRGSAAVAVGTTVAVKQALGKVGNSGYSLEPHLHIGAKRSGVEVGLVFDGRWLSVNSVVRVGEQT